MKKIYWLIQQLEVVGGTEMVSSQIMNGLSQNHDITLICLAKKSTSTVYTIDPSIKITYLNIDTKYLRFDEYVSKLKHDRKIISLFILFLKVAFFWLFKRFYYRSKIKRMTTKDDIIVASSLDNYILTPRGRTVIYHFHFNGKFFFSFAQQMGFLLCRKPTYWVFLTKTTYDKIMQKRKKIRKNSTFIYNPTRFESKLSTSNYGNRLIFVGRYSFQKRPLLAIELANELNKLKVDFIFDFYGGGPLKEKMIELVSKYNLNNKVIIHDSNSKIIQELQKSDLLIMTSSFEGLPLVIIEANSQSLPVVTLYWGDATKEIVQDGINGYVIDNDDIIKQAHTIKDLLENQTKLAHLKESSYFFSDQFSIKNIIDKWNELLNKF